MEVTRLQLEPSLRAIRYLLVLHVADLAFADALGKPLWTFLPVHVACARRGRRTPTPDTTQISHFSTEHRTPAHAPQQRWDPTSRTHVPGAAHEDRRPLCRLAESQTMAAGGRRGHPPPSSLPPSTSHAHRCFFTLTRHRVILPYVIPHYHANYIQQYQRATRRNEPPIVTVSRVFNIA